jgi:hypothetical protein
MATTKQFIEVDRREINYIQSIVEAYDGMAVVRTIDPHRALIEIRISPGCEDMVSELLDSLAREEGLVKSIDKKSDSYKE